MKSMATNNRRRIVPASLCLLFLACLAAFRISPAQDREGGNEIVANLAGGRVIVHVARDKIVFAAIDQPVEPSSIPPRVLSIDSRHIGVLLGASEWRLFWRVTLPLTRRPVFAAAALAFAQSLGEFGATLMVAGNIPGRPQTMALAIYDAVESDNGRLARILVLVISAIALAILTLANRLVPAGFKTR